MIFKMIVMDNKERLLDRRIIDVPSKEENLRQKQ